MGKPKLANMETKPDKAIQTPITIRIILILIHNADFASTTKKVKNIAVFINVSF